MPFGLIFGALFFGGLCVFAAAGLLGHPALAVKLSGVFLALLGLSLSIGLLTRRPWARWVAVVFAPAVAAAVSLRRVGTLGDVADYTCRGCRDCGAARADGDGRRPCWSAGRSAATGSNGPP